MAPTSILIVSSDTKTSRDLHQRLVNLSYHVVGVAGTKKEAAAKIEDLKPNLIITDINLNRKGGGIKTGGLVNSAYHLPVIYIAADMGEAILQRAKSTDPFGYIFDPADDKQLLATIETALARHRLERKLRESRQWLNTTLTSVGDAIIATDENGIVRFINPAAMELTGWESGEGIGRPLQDIFALQDEKSARLFDLAYIQNKLSEAKKTHLKGTLCAKSGMVIPVEGTATIINNDNGGSLGMVLVFRDFTNQRDALLEVQQQANRAEVLVQAASKLNERLDLESVLNTVCILVNETLKTTGTAVFLKTPDKSNYHMMTAYGENPALQSYTSRKFEIENQVLSPMFTRENPVVIIRDLQSRVDLPYPELARELNIGTVLMAALYRRDTMIGALISILINEHREFSTDDLTLLRGLADQASTAIENADLFDQVRAGRTRQQSLARQIVKVQEDERRSLSRELHDQIGQMLTGLQFSIKSILAQPTEEQQNKLDQVQIVISVIISQIRELSINLRPSLLDDLGILPTLMWHFERYEAKTGILVNFRHRNLDQRFSPELEITTFRIVQEALTNVARYAKTDRVEVSIEVIDTALLLEIHDQGVGFDMARLSKNESVGLEGMRERAYAIGGMLEIDSKQGQGTHLAATLPVTGQLERRYHERDHSTGR